jgi:hypothetical protein
MKQYRNLQGDSGVMAFETGDDYIKILFRGGDVYLYTNAVTGREHVTEMKKRAIKGKGLSTYISQHVKNRYAEKL